MAKNKQTKKGNQTYEKRTIIIQTNQSLNQKPAWKFDRIDKNGKFAFDINRSDFNAKELISKLVSYSTMTWGEIERQTHDNSKSKNHYLDIRGLSEDACDRLSRMGLEEETDKLFSLALQNKLRLIGLRNGAEFSVLWYDSNHEVYPSTKK